MGNCCVDNEAFNFLNSDEYLTPEERRKIKEELLVNITHDTSMITLDRDNKSITPPKKIEVLAEEEKVEITTEPTEKIIINFEKEQKKIDKIQQKINETHIEKTIKNEKKNKKVIKKINEKDLNKNINKKYDNFISDREKKQEKIIKTELLQKSKSDLLITKKVKEIPKKEKVIFNEIDRAFKDEKIFYDIDKIEKIDNNNNNFVGKKQSVHLDFKNLEYKILDSEDNKILKEIDKKEIPTLDSYYKNISNFVDLSPISYISPSNFDNLSNPFFSLPDSTTNFMPLGTTNFIDNNFIPICDNNAILNIGESKPLCDFGLGLDGIELFPSYRF